jgi:hypothetical protein
MFQKILCPIDLGEFTPPQTAFARSFMLDRFPTEPGMLDPLLGPTMLVLPLSLSKNDKKTESNPGNERRRLGTYFADTKSGQKEKDKGGGV